MLFGVRVKQVEPLGLIDKKYKPSGFYDQLETPKAFLYIQHNEKHHAHSST